MLTKLEEKDKTCHSRNSESIIAKYKLLLFNLAKFPFPTVHGRGII